MKINDGDDDDNRAEKTPSCRPKRGNSKREIARNAPAMKEDDNDGRQIPIRVREL